MKKIILIILLIFSNVINAERIFDFHIYELNISNYPMINLKGIIESPYDEHIGVENLILNVNGKLIEELECEFYKINSKHIIFEIRYISRLPKESERDYLVDYQYHGFHNGYGQKFSFKPNFEKIIYSDYKQNESNVFGTNISDLINLFNSHTRTIVDAKNGLIVREKPSINSNRIGKLKFKNKYYVSTRPFSEEIKIEDDNELIYGKFKEIFFKNKKGYVFDGYLKPLDLETNIRKSKSSNIEVVSKTYVSDNHSCEASFKPKNTHNLEDFNGIYGSFQDFYIEILHSNEKLFIRKRNDEIERVDFKLDNNNNIVFNNNSYKIFECTSNDYPQKNGDVGLGYVKKLLYNNTQINLLFFNEKEELEKNVGEYPETSFVKLNSKELNKYSKNELKIMRNEVFARNGHIFNGIMGNYFSNKKWYKPKKKITEDELTAIEEFNVLLIRKIEVLK